MLEEFLQIHGMPGPEARDAVGAFTNWLADRTPLSLQLSRTRKGLCFKITTGAPPRQASLVVPGASSFLPTPP